MPVHRDSSGWVWYTIAMPFVPERRSTRTERRLDRVFLFAVLALVMFGVGLPDSVFALSGAFVSAVNYILLLLVQLLEWLLNFFGTLILLFVDMIISVAQYNDFVGARPVEAGWPLIRDVANMFFIVILLVAAFSTIIQYQKFHYKKVLPKLLLMAVLVNFSKTLVGLLIDLSQVIMLTFVNGFQAAAAGNFTQALKLDKVLQWAADGGATSAAGAGEGSSEIGGSDSFLIKILMAELLGMFILGISLITLILLLLYLVFRVVGLWIALILSPAAFFASALDQTPLSKGLSFITGNFWPRLWALLTGGPVMAFFLWLTLATVQTGGFGDFTDVGASTARQAERGQSISYFATEVGGVQEVATFFVAVMMLMMGLEAALSISNQVSGTLGKAGQNIRSAGMAATRFAAYGGLARGVGIGARVGKRAARGGARFVDSRVNLSGGVGKLVQQAGVRIPAALGGTAVAAAGAKLRGAGGERRKEFEKRFERQLDNMMPGEEMDRLKKLTKSANKNKAKAAQNRLGKLMTSKPGAKALKERYKEEGKKLGKEGDELDAYADLKTREETQAQFAEFKQLAQDTQDKEMLEKVDDTVEKRPDHLKGKDFDDQMTKVIDQGAQQAARKISPDAWQDSRTLNSIIAKTDVWDEARNDWNEDSEWYKRVIKPPGSRRDYFEAHKQALQERAASEQTTVRAAAAAATPEAFYTRKGQKVSRYAPEALKAAGPAERRGRARRRRDPDVRAASERTRQLREEIRNVPTNPADFSVASARSRNVENLRQVQYDGMAAGSRVREVYGLNDQGEFATPEDRQNFARNTQEFVRAAGNDHTMYQNLDTSDLYANPDGKNEARASFASQADIGQMDQAWRSAAEAHDEASMEQIQAAAGAVRHEGVRVESRIATWNERHADAPIRLDEVITAGRGENQAALDAAVQAMPENEKITMEQARALAHKEDLNDDTRDIGRFLQRPPHARAEEAAARARVRRQQAARTQPEGGNRDDAGGTQAPSPATPPPPTPPPSPPPPPPPNTAPPNSPNT